MGCHLKKTKECAQRVSDYLASLDKSGTALARLTGVNRTTIDRVMSDGSDNISLDVIFTICENCKKSPVDFICPSPNNSHQQFLDEISWLTRSTSPQSLRRIVKIVKAFIEDDVQV